MQDRYLTTEEVASMLKITISTLRRLTHNGTIRGFKFGHKIRYKEEDISNSLSEITNPLKPQPHGQ